MRDRNRDRLSLLYPEVETKAFEVLDTLRKRGVDMFIVEGLRSFARQEELFSYGRTNLSRPKVTKARPGESLHHYGLAVDFAFSGKETYPSDKTKWQPFLDVAKEKGFVSLSKIGDYPHIQMTFGLTILTFEPLYRTGGLSAVWSFIDRTRGVGTGVKWATRLKKAEEYLGVLKTG